MNVFNDVMNTAGGKEEKPENGLAELGRFKRSEGVVFEIARSACMCDDEGSTESCDADKVRKPDKDEKPCFCGFDRHAGDAFPCHMPHQWTKVKRCYSCNVMAFCHESAESKLGSLEQDCICRKFDDFCLAYSGDILNLWEYYGDAQPTEDPGFLEALGFGGMTDEVAIVTKAKENIVFAMATLSNEQRSELSYTLDEFVLRCSFNSKQCNIQQDFLQQVDPNFGNCFTFNHDRNNTIRASRAGSSFG